MLTFFLAASIGCAGQLPPGKPSNDVNPDQLTSALAKHCRDLVSLPGVTAAAEGTCDGKPCIVIYISSDTDNIRKSLPQSIDGIPVSIRVSGDIKATD